MGLRFLSQTNADCFFVTTTFKDWIKLGDIDGFYSALSDNLLFYLNKYKAMLAGYVFMPDHLHLIIFIGGSKLAGFMRDFKKYTSQKIVKRFDVKESTIWFPRYDRLAIYSEDVMKTKLMYIHNNPVKKDLVEDTVDWEWSSARDYLTDKIGRLPVFKDW